MTKKHLYVPFALAFAAVGCNSSSEDKVSSEFTYTPNASTVEFEDMNPDANPTTDFYEFVNGKWIERTSIPATESSWGKFNVLSDNNNKVLHEILEEVSKEKAEPGTVNQLIGDYYYAVMDSVKRDAEGVKPIAAELALVDKLNAPGDLAKLMAHQHRIGIGTFFGFGVDQDLKDNTKMALYAGSGGLTLPSSEYYTKTDEESEKIKKLYREHLKTMFGFLGYAPADAEKAATDVYTIESMLADSSLTPLEERDIEGQYNKMSWNDFKKMAPDHKLDVYAKDLGFKIPAEIIVSVPKYIRGFQNIIKTRQMPEIKNYMKWRTLHAFGDHLSGDIEKAEFAFFKTTLKGAKEMKPRWKRAIDNMSDSPVGEALGHAFVDKQFSPEAKKRVNEMVDNIFEAFKLRLDTLEWMSPETRKKAHEKLASFTRKLCYPEKWTDFSKLKLTRDSYVQNAMACGNFTMDKNIEKLYKPIEKDEWQMCAHEVNAYYNPLWNEIVFPAGIMQPPFFDVNKEDAVNYARMGAVIGHELTHGFDDQGAQFDAGGNLVNWWTEQDLKNFTERTKKLIACFDSFEALPGVHVNGSLTVGENIADLGGLKIAYYAYQRSLKDKKRETINGFSPEQRFFIAFGQIWCSKFTDTALKNLIYTNVHAPGKYRVLGPLSNMEEFFTAFNVKEGDKMRMPEDKISRIW